MKKNKLILFDWGNIVESNLTGYTLRQAFNDLLIYFGCPLEDPYADLAKYHLSDIHTMEEFENTVNEMKKDLHFECDFQTFTKKYEEFLDKIDYFEDVRDYEHSLKDKCYIGILSDLDILDKNRIDKQLGLKTYDYVFLSFELGMKKPNMEIFEYVGDHIPFDKKDVLFIDDRESNIETAKEYGWNTCHTTGLHLDIIKEACEKFLEGE